ncbi:AMP phosphorylase [Candidatus Anstonella stagnisolia]|nr:AMP phosphorylase [Candidatus Anstonella stagnisolia]
MSKKEKEKAIKKEKVWQYKQYNCAAKCVNLTSGQPIVVLNETEAHQNDLYASHRVILRCNGKETIAILDLSKDMASAGEIVLFDEVAQTLGAKNGARVQVQHTMRPESIDYIKKKLDAGELSHRELDVITQDLMANRLSEAELASFITAVYTRGMSDAEIVGLTKSIVSSGEVLSIGKSPIVDKHCIGGVAGNRTTMVMVPIIAAAGIYMPKTSSRSITSSAGTADTMEVLCPVTFPVEEMRSIVLKARGCIAWGGAMRLAAADDKLIKIRNPLSLDPKGVLLASILAKKKSVGAQFAVIDIPIGRGAKLATAKEATALGHDFINIGKQLGIKIEVLTTDGSDPIGNGIGPALECRDVFEVLEGEGPADLRDKSCLLAGTLLELCGKVPKGKGFDAASSILQSGKALVKFREIIELQGGNGKVRISDLPIGKYKHGVIAPKTGRIAHVDNKMLSKIARAAGAPADKGAGVYLHCEAGDKVTKGDILFDIYSESEAKLDFAIKALEGWWPMDLQKVILGTML